MKAALARFCLAFCASLAAALPAAADHNDLVHVDVVDGWVTPDGTVMAGLRIQVADGWKTYWRSPGDVGVPPRFDWSASKNLKAVRLHWPRPEIFETFGQRTLGYSGEIVLPVELFPADASKPVTVAGTAELGLCRDICVAVNQAYFDSNLAAPDAIRRAMAEQPDRSRISSASCKVAPIKDGLRVTASLALPPQGGAEIAVMELGDSGEIWVSEPEVSRRGNSLTATADLVPPEAAPFALDRSKLRITVLGRNGAAETMGCPAG
ncbi:protein-disulfide reductase DsbD domain-containing protein [Mangrovicoccus sp. HB161399]|uniref:protein-disulfide reductase DsbD domain-containing protein n=1 Tax=Mangrovicoccus sp. HB161399 TaxID=2720392 RepID=UPI00155727CB|nr:protein-disulfide reductase DsbD domain-containing protein [Mangrovicoccus sp. HB161399]